MPENERRKACRYGIDIAALLEGSTPGEERLISRGRTVNVSCTGAFFRTTEKFQNHARVFVDLFLMTERLRRFMSRDSVHIRLTGVVVRNDAAGVAIKFGRRIAVSPAFSAPDLIMLQERNASHRAGPPPGSLNLGLRPGNPLRKEKGD